MTQDVQPLTWQKRTNLEEHQQFFSKINEIIDNLAPTVDEAEAAIAQATAAIASANDAIATANAASAAASAAATQAQTAASTVAGYDTRLTAAEGDIDALQAADQTMAGNITALGTRMTAAETKNNQQDTAIGALQTADANNVKITGTHAIGDYAVLLSDNQRISGIKAILGNQLFMRSTTLVEGEDLVPYGAYPALSFVDKVHTDAGAFDNDHCSARIASVQNNTYKTIEIANFFTFNGARNSFSLQMIANQTTGSQFVRIKWSDNTYTNLATKQL